MFDTQRPYWSTKARAHSVLWTHSTARTNDAWVGKMRLGLKHAEPEATVWKNILISRHIILQTEGMVCINVQSQEKFCPVRNLMTNAVYAVINTSYFFSFLMDITEIEFLRYLCFWTQTCSGDMDSKHHCVCNCMFSESQL